MNLTEKQGYIGLNKQTVGSVWADWLARGAGIDFNYGLTVMPGKRLVKHLAGVRNVNGNKAYRHLNRDELEQALHRLVDILNRLIYKNAYKRFGKKLDGIMVIEGDYYGKDLHAHFALSKPKYLTVKEFAKLVRRALDMSGDFAICNPNYNPNNDNLDKKYRYKLDIIDRDWLYYITKELNNDTVQNLHFI